MQVLVAKFAQKKKNMQRYNDIYSFANFKEENKISLSLRVLIWMPIMGGWVGKIKTQVPN